MPAKLTMPTLGLTNPRFRYRNASSTDISETFKRARRAMNKAKRDADNAQQALELEPVDSTAATVVVAMPRRARGAA
ncbi:hypothetical protein [Acidovorax sp. M2(2025)]|uniref:hypothetical protein n=1 Tax=Acidovorax sp. M2(2025) TaxID=3411355 RepID=UPI003BF48ED4